MSVEQAIYTRLSTFPGLVALVSTRVYPNLMPQNASLPAVTYQLISYTPVSAMGGDIGDVPARVQVNSWGKTYPDAKGVAAQVRKALQRYTTTKIADIFIENEFDDYEPQTKLHKVITDFRVHYEE